MKTTALAVAITTVAGTASSQDVLLGNLPDTFGTGGSVGLTETRSKAVSFTIPAGPGFTFDALTLALASFEVGDTAFGQIRASDGTNNPTETVLSTVFYDGDGSVGTQTNSPDTPFSFVGGETYWLVVGSLPSGSSITWSRAQPDITPAGLADFGEYRFRASTTWGSSSQFNNFVIEGTLVPAPASAGLLGLAGLAAARRRR
ncbi:MAG: choice-of-anchor R domain-containing protein [Planctomycetota bacterium]